MKAMGQLFGVKGVEVDHAAVAWLPLPAVGEAESVGEAQQRHSRRLLVQPRLQLAHDRGAPGEVELGSFGVQQSVDVVVLPATEVAPRARTEELHQVAVWLLDARRAVEEGR